ncbi:DUF1127 domain-containing protein [Mesorhizobium sp. M0293]|uniref:DUF1127 domain-containing protein n=1 Tax=unclassified Mesorhizobium TaxID=325217 RepID=UPI00333C200A
MRSDHTAAIPARAPTIHTATMRHFLSVQFIAAAGWINRQMERRRSRRALLEMTDDQLKDIGLSRGEAYSDSLRRLWD